MATPDEIDTVWLMLVAAYPYFEREQGAKLAKTLNVYEQILADLPGDVLRASALQHVASSRFFPTVAELRERAALICTPEISDCSGVVAWGKVLDTFMDGRYYRFEDGHEITPQFDDPIIAKMVASMGGYWHLYECHRSAEGNPAADRARFVEGYEALKRRQRDEALTLAATKDLQYRLEDEKHKTLDMWDDDTPALPERNFALVARNVAEKRRA